MEYLFSILVFVALAFAANDGCTETCVDINHGTSGTDAVSFTVLNDWPQTQSVYGLDIYEDASSFYILGSDKVGMKIQAYNASGVPDGSLPLAAGNTYCFGIAWNNDPDIDTYYTNDWYDTVLYYTEDFGISWTTTANPAGSNGRGMDFDGTDYWCALETGGSLWRFQPGVGAQNIAIPEVPGHTSGLAVFPYGGNLGVAVGSQSIPHSIYFHEWDGTTMSFLGSAECPVFNVCNYGLAYSETTGYLYWSYLDVSSIYHIVEMSFDINMALEPSSWGSIKTSF